MADAKTPKSQPIVIAPVVFHNVFSEAPKDNPPALRSGPPPIATAARAEWREH